MEDTNTATPSVFASCSYFPFLLSVLRMPSNEMPAATATDNRTFWFRDAVVYQIWPASYKDSNNDGIGDIRGIISTLDYVASLGVNVIWLSPMYDSPQVDMGYDISDYQNVYPPYGTLADMDDLIRECHSRGIKLILDWSSTILRTNMLGSKNRRRAKTTQRETGTSGDLPSTMLKATVDLPTIGGVR